MVVVAPCDAEDDGEMELDLEVHGACVPEETYKTESAWKCCQLGASCIVLSLVLLYNN